MTWGTQMNDGSSFSDPQSRIFMRSDISVVRDPRFWRNKMKALVDLSGHRCGRCCGVRLATS